MQRIQFKTGFTLIELLVVMSIIAILLAISAFGIALMFRNNRNTQRANYINDIKIGLERFYASYGTYPAPAQICISSDMNNIVFRTASESGSVQIPNTRGDLLIPSAESSRTTSAYCYQNRAGGLYSLQYQFETQAGVDWSIELGTSNDPCEDEGVMTLNTCS